MKKLLIIKLLLFLILNSGYSQVVVKQTSQWKSYEGKLVTGKTKVNIETSILFLNEGYIVGSYKEIDKQKNHKIVGQIINDTLLLTIREHILDSVEGFWIATLQNQDKILKGVYKSTDGLIIGKFNLKHSMYSSYTDYIMKYRALKESKSVEEALKKPNEVLSLDFEDQGLSSLPEEFSKLSKLISSNLSGNRFKSFPIVLTKLKTIEEISLSTNRILDTITSEIGKLKNLRVLILNNNSIKELPKEIGKLSNLLYLEIGNNKIKTLPEEIKNLTK